MVANADGSDIHPIAEVQGQVEDWQWTEWSPDGRSIAVLWSVGGGQAISILNADGSPFRTLELGDLWPTEVVSWLPPEGRELIFQADPGGTAPRGIYAIRPDGTGLRTIAVSQDTACQDCPFQQPTLSPDGRLMAYWSWEANDAGVAGGYLHLRDLVSGDDEVFAPYADYPGTGFSPRFSPDGRSLLVESGPHDEAGKALEATGAVTGQLVLAPLEGDGPARLMGDWYTDDSQTSEFSPDGTLILQDRGAGGSWVIDVATGTSTPTEEYVLAPSWQRLAP
jgi:Tol biopolymer transport system component